MDNTCLRRHLESQIPLTQINLIFSSSNNLLPDVEPIGFSDWLYMEESQELRTFSDQGNKNV